MSGDAFEFVIVLMQFIVSMQPVYGLDPRRFAGRHFVRGKRRGTGHGENTAETVFSYQPPRVTRARRSATSKHEFRSVTNARSGRGAGRAHVCPRGETSGYICARENPRSRVYAYASLFRPPPPPPPRTLRDEIVSSMHGNHVVDVRVERRRIRHMPPP